MIGLLNKSTYFVLKEILNRKWIPIKPKAFTYSPGTTNTSWDISLFIIEPSSEMSISLLVGFKERHLTEVFPFICLLVCLWNPHLTFSIAWNVWGYKINPTVTYVFSPCLWCTNSGFRFSSCVDHEKGKSAALFNIFCSLIKGSHSQTSLSKNSNFCAQN